jgi:hypothetical protein
MLALVSSPNAFAQTPEGTATFAEMGLGAARTILAGEAQTLVLPADGRVVPERVSGTVTRTDGTARAVLRLRAGGRDAGRVVLGAGQRTATFDVALGAPRRDEAFVELELAAESPDAQRCDARSGVELTGAAAAYRRTGPPPDAVSATLPGVLKRLRVIVPDPASPEHATAAVRLASALTARYAGQHVALDVAGDLGAFTADPDPFGATVIVRDGPPRVATEDVPGGAPAVVVSGGEGSIAGQADLAIERLRLIGRTEQAAGLPLPAPAELPGTVRTFADLGARELRARGLGELSVSVPFSQSDLGGPVRGLSLQLRGSVSAIADEADAALTVELDGQVVGSWPLEKAGPFEHDIDVPPRLLARDNALRVAATYTLPDGGCGDVPLTLTVDPRSTFTTEFGLGPLAGLGDVPQALLPIAGLALTRRDAATVGAAVQLGGLLQRLTRRPLAFRTVSEDEARHGQGPAILVGLGAPLPAAADDGPVAALWATRAGERTLVSAGYREDGALLGALLDRLAQRPDGLAFAGTAAAVVKPDAPGLRLLPAVAAAPRDDGTGDGGLPGALVVGGAAALVLLVAGGGWWLNRRYW